VADVNTARDRRWPYYHAWRAAFNAAKADPKMTREQIERLARKEYKRQKRMESGA